MISAVLWGAFFFGYAIVSVVYVFAVFLFIGYALWLVIDDVNIRYCIFGSWRKHRLYGEDAKDIFWSDGIYASYHGKEITLYVSYIKSKSMRELELSAIEFGRVHHPNLKAYLCIENGQGYIRYREEMTAREIRESTIYDSEVWNTPIWKRIDEI